MNDRALKVASYTCEYERKYQQPIEDLPVTTGLWMWRHVIENCLGLKPSGPLSTRKSLYWADLPGFEDGILHTVNNSIDRDTAGAVAGAILGTYWGESRIPDRWRDKVEKANKIRDLADKLIAVCGPGKTEQSSNPR